VELEKTYVGCALCGSDDYALLYEGKDWMLATQGLFRVVVCRSCHLVYLNPRPDEASLAHYYPEEYPPFAIPKGPLGFLTMAIRKRTARKVRRWLPPQARILEIGCATGDLMVPLREEGFEVAGIDISPYAAASARERHGLNVHTGTVFDAPFEAGSFDGLVMRGVLEHMPSPKDALVKARSFLRDGGYLFLATPNFDSLDRRVFGEFWHGLQIPRHLNLFTIETLARLLEETGFEARHVRYRIVTNDWFKSSLYFLEDKFGKQPWLSTISMQNPLLHIAFLPLTLLQSLLKIGGRMEVVAAKTSRGIGSTL
jgi:2-polyprenyl-3-methyl-5-hydroxy-6-metoxy-1,4-benzoquinol methylase